MIDIHCHLQDSRLVPFLSEVVETLPRLGVERIVVNGTSENDWDAVRCLAESYSWVSPAYGLHPWKAHEASHHWESKLAEYLDHESCGVGECGLDKWMRGADLDLQEGVFRKQIALARERELPLFIHGLQCWGRMKSVLSSERLPCRGFLLHSYSGPLEMVDAFVHLGAYFSFSGYFLHERKEDRRRVFKTIPLDRLCVETDAPDMHLPDSLNAYPDFKVKTGSDSAFTALNHPGNLAVVYSQLAGLRSMSLPEFTAQIMCNFRNLMGHF